MAARRGGGCDGREGGAVEALLQWQKVSDLAKGAILSSFPLLSSTVERGEGRSSRGLAGGTGDPLHLRRPPWSRMRWGSADPCPAMYSLS